MTVLLSSAILLLTLSAQAKITCYDSKELNAGHVMAQMVIKNMKDFFRKKGIDLNEASINLQIDSASIYHRTDEYDQNSEIQQASFRMDYNRGPMVESRAGTKFKVYYTGPFGPSAAAYYDIVDSHKGYDREGNEIAGHCSLKLANASWLTSYGTSAEVINATSGKVMGQFPIPGKIDLY